MYRRYFDRISFYLKSIFLIMIYFSCDEPEVNKSDSSFYPLSNPNFTFHQDQNRLFFSVQVEEEDGGSELDSVSAYWFGGSRENTPDIIILNDDGLKGDIIMNDNVFSRKIPNDSLKISNFLQNDTGKVYIEYYADFSDSAFILGDTNQISNIPPTIDSISAPNFILRPLNASSEFYQITVKTYDPDGLETISFVGFRSFHVEGDSLVNNGDYIELFDDGGEVSLYPNSDITSGDTLQGDGVFSFIIAVHGTQSQDPNFQTKAGTFHWRFICRDIQNAYSQIVEHEIVIE